MSEYGPGKIGKWIKDNPEEAQKAKVLGGKAKGESCKRKKLLKEYLEALLEAKTETGDKYADITLALVQKALDGDVHAYEVIRDTLGQKEADKVELNNNDIKINIK